MDRVVNDGAVDDNTGNCDVANEHDDGDNNDVSKSPPGDYPESNDVCSSLGLQYHTHCPHT